MSDMRFTVVDPGGTISFTGPAHGLKILAAACSRQPRDYQTLMRYAGELDSRFATSVVHGLSVFDEHNTVNDLTAIRSQLVADDIGAVPPFRVLDELTRRRSLEPERAGLVVFNLKAQRIVQVQNSYAELKREDRGRRWRDGQPTDALYHYRLPAGWSILP